MAGSSNPSPSGDQSGHHQSIMSVFQSNKMDVLLLFTRLGTLISCIVFILSPFWSQNAATAAGYVWYQRALISNAATSALRLRQRIALIGGRIGLSRDTLQMLLAEDSFHYLLYSILFLMMAPVTVALIPVFAFALLHTASYTDNLLHIMSRPAPSNAHGDVPAQNGSTSFPPLSWLQAVIRKVRANESTILRLIAMNEIILMVISIVVAFTRSGSIMLPLFYYNILKLRYASRRNPFVSITFYEMRLVLQEAAYHPKCPSFFSRLIFGLINVMSSLSPPVANS